MAQSLSHELEKERIWYQYSTMVIKNAKILQEKARYTDAVFRIKKVLVQESLIIPAMTAHEESRRTACKADLAKVLFENLILAGEFKEGADLLSALLEMDPEVTVEVVDVPLVLETEVETAAPPTTGEEMPPASLDLPTEADQDVPASPATSGNEEESVAPATTYPEHDVEADGPPATQEEMPAASVDLHAEPEQGVPASPAASGIEEEPVGPTTTATTEEPEVPPSSEAEPFEHVSLDSAFNWDDITVDPFAPVLSLGRYAAIGTALVAGAGLVTYGLWKIFK